MDFYLMFFLKKLRRILKPRYHLALDEFIYNTEMKNFSYRFKIYASHSFVKFSFHEIYENRDVLFDINPYDLIKIASNEFKHSQSLEILKIKETLRNNEYKIFNHESEQIISGEDLCDNSSLIQKLNSLDAYKIAYTTGFNHGRKFSKSISSQKENEISQPSFKLVKSQQ
jgi:hypothetical protein